MADTPNLSPCKVTFNGAFRRFLIARPATWNDFEAKLRGVYNLSADTLLNVQYKDEEGDVITLNTDNELEDVLTMHDMFSQVAPVRFELSIRHDDQEASSTFSNQHHHHQQLTQPETQTRSSTVQSDDSSDDGSLIDFEEASENVLDQEPKYPQPIVDDAAIDNAALRYEQEMVEAFRQENSVLSSGVLGAPQATSPDADIQIESVDTVATPLLVDTTEVLPKSPSSGSRRSSQGGSPIVPVIEFEALRMENAPEVMDSILASAIEQHAEQVAEAARARSESDDNASQDPAEVEIGAATSEEQVPVENEPALLEQFQMLIEEFQHVIQNNPQLVELAGSIMNKAAAHANAAHANARDSEAAAPGCPFSSGEDQSFGPRGSGGFFGSGQGGFFGQGGRPFWHGGPPGWHHRRHHHHHHHEDPFAGIPVDACSSDEDRSKDHKEGETRGHGHDYGHYRGRRHCRRGNRGGFFSGMFPSMPAMPPMPPMPPMPNMPVMPNMPPMPPMPPVPPMPPMPGMSFMSGMMGGGSKKSDGSHVPCSKPSPFGRGFPFLSGVIPEYKNTFKFNRRGCRPNVDDTEASSSSAKDSEMKNLAGEGSSSSKPDGGMPGSFPGAQAPSSASPMMSGSQPGWTWTQLTDKAGTDGSHPKYGWVWTGLTGEETGEPTPLYSATSEDDDMADASAPAYPHHVPPPPPPPPFGGLGRGRGRGHFGSFRGHHHHHHHQQQHPPRRHSRSGGEDYQETQDKDKDDKDDSSLDEKLKRRQTFHEQRHAMKQLRKEQLQEQRQMIAKQREMIEEQRKVQEQQRRAHEEQRKAEEQRRRENRVSQLVGQSAGLNATAATTPAVAVGGGSLAGIWPTAAVISNDSENENEKEKENTKDRNPFEDQDEYVEEIYTLVSMGFTDNADLRAIVKELGGQLEAVIERLLQR
ncbi:hypothetical protein BGZ94_010047 [Podila epigama]|nr:hypothetical protein BGZ94_010047 [Podila epigama]